MAKRHDSEYCGGMLILAFDTTAAACSVALWRDGTVLHGSQAVMDYGQAEALMPLIEETMRAVGLSYAALDRIAVTTGPGSFTGVRVGLAAARGLAMAAEKPVIGITTTEVLAHAVPDGEAKAHTGIIAAIDTKRGDIFVQKFTSAREAMDEILPLTPDAIKAWAGPGSWIVVGDGARIVAQAIDAHVFGAGGLPDAGVLARLAAMRTPQVGGPLPLYVHAPSITMPA